MAATGRIYRYEGLQASVTWDKSRCIHAGECTRGLPSVFSAKHDPWAQPDNASLAALAAVIDRCPTGALAIEHPAQLNRPADARNSVTLVVDGPLYARGRISIGGAPVETRVALCRCGASSNKPYCDRSHRKAGFKHDGRLGSADDPAEAEPRDNVDFAVTPTPNASLHCTGRATLVGADGTRSVTSDTWLCRCGGSSNKPYCDGTHRKIGFAG